MPQLSPAAHQESPKQVCDPLSPVQAQLDLPVTARVHPEEQHFLMAARALQKRLVMAHTC